MLNADIPVNLLTSLWVGIPRQQIALVATHTSGGFGGNALTKETKRILLVNAHNAFRESLAARLNQEEDLEVVWQAGSLASARNVHLDGVDVTVVDPLLPDGNGLVLIQEVSMANPNALAVVLSSGLDSTMRHQALAAGAATILNTNTFAEEVIKAVRRSAEAN